MSADRLTIDDENLNAKLRFAGYHLVNHFLNAARELRQMNDVDPASILILLTIRVASIQRTLRKPGESEIDQGDDAIAPHHFQPISRRAVAEATGLPRESVRRKINEMIKKGLILEEGAGVLTMNVVTDPVIASQIRQLAAGHVQVTNLLTAEGILKRV